MEAALYVLKNVTSVALMVLMAAMLVRAILSWFPGNGGGMLENFIYTLTEPFIIPVRSLLERIEWVRNAPIDISFFITFLIISLLFDAIP